MKGWSDTLRAGFAIGAALCVATPARADVCLLNSKSVVDKAVALLNGTDALIVSCGVCANRKAFAIPMRVAQAVSTDDPSYYTVKIDGHAVDLAYLYYLPAAGAPRWINVGFSAGCADMQDVAVVELPREVSDTPGPPPRRPAR